MGKLIICWGGNGVPTHKEIAFADQVCCPWCSERTTVAGKVADLNEKIAELEMIISKLEVDR